MRIRSLELYEHITNLHTKHPARALYNQDTCLDIDKVRKVRQKTRLGIEQDVCVYIRMLVTEINL